MKNPKRYLITAALPYANGPVHIGHLAGCYLPADIYVRYLKAQGKEVIFICGSVVNIVKQVFIRFDWRNELSFTSDRTINGTGDDASRTLWAIHKNDFVTVTVTVTVTVKHV
jgi:hypothetical protein